MEKEKVPNHLINYLSYNAQVCCSQTKTITAQKDQYNWNVDQPIKQ